MKDIDALLRKAPYVLLADFLPTDSLSHFLLWGKIEETHLVLQVFEAVFWMVVREGMGLCSSNMAGTLYVCL